MKVTTPPVVYTIKTKAGTITRWADGAWGDQNGQPIIDPARLKPLEEDYQATKAALQNPRPLH